MKVTEHVPEDSVQLEALNVPPVVPADKVKLTEPVGVFEAAVISLTVPVTVVAQLDAPNAIVQPPPATVTVVVVSSLPVAVTMIAAAALALPLWVVSPP